MKRLHSLRGKALSSTCKLIFACGGLLAVQSSFAVKASERLPASVGVPTHYRITDLGTLGGSNSWTLSKDWHTQLFGPVLAPALNDNAEVIGYSQTSTGDIEPFFWKKGRMRPLHPPLNWHVDTSMPKLGSAYRLFYINSQGHILGTAFETQGESDSDTFAFLTDGIKYRRIGLGSRGDDTILYDNLAYENSLGTQRKGAGAAEHQRRHFSVAVRQTVSTGVLVDQRNIRGYTLLWNKKRWLSLVVAKGYQKVQAFQVNGDGKVIGINYYYAAANGKRISEQQYLHTLSSDPPNSRHSAGFVWSGGHMYPLPSPRHYTLCLPTSINEKGEIVGVAGNDHQTKSVAVLWKQGHVYDLNSLVPADAEWTLGDTAGINNRGQIAATGYSKMKQVPTGETNGGVSIMAPETHVLLLTPVL